MTVWRGQSGLGRLQDSLAMTFGLLIEVVQKVVETHSVNRHDDKLLQLGIESIVHLRHLLKRDSEFGSTAISEMSRSPSPPGNH